MPLLDLLFPHICVGCKKELPEGALCVDCEALLPTPTAPRCPHCNARIPGQTLSPSCQKALGITTLTTVGPYKHPLLRATIDALKYDGIRDLAIPLSAHLVQNLKLLNEKRIQNTFIIVPIPLHPKRLRERGYNQSALIAQTIAHTLKIAYKDRILIRSRPTAPQAKLIREARLLNVENAFMVLPKTNIKEKIILLVDDVITTGATMRNAARVLRSAGAKEIWAAAVAQG